MAFVTVVQAATAAPLNPAYWQEAFEFYRDDLKPRALILHSLGTTSRPKIVPLLPSTIAASARTIGRSLNLTAEDRCRNVMPLFHIHGLVVAVALSLAAGDPSDLRRGSMR